jgi:hypothetical protein
LAEQRSRLDSRIAKFNRDAIRLLHLQDDDVDEAVDPLGKGFIFAGLEEDEEDEVYELCSNDLKALQGQQEINPEVARILLPSSFPAEVQERLEMEDIDIWKSAQSRSINIRPDLAHLTYLFIYLTKFSGMARYSAHLAVPGSPD